MNILGVIIGYCFFLFCSMIITAPSIKSETAAAAAMLDQDNTDVMKVQLQYLPQTAGTVVDDADDRYVCVYSIYMYLLSYIHICTCRKRELVLAIGLFLPICHEH